jgi:hypothetical protein
MNICKECLCYEACSYHIDEETDFTVNECSTGFKNKNEYVRLPAYVGQTVWVPYVYYYKELYSKVEEGKVSMLQLKADGSWKIRISKNGSVSDYTVEDFNKHVFLTKEAAETERKRLIKEFE